MTLTLAKILFYFTAKAKINAWNCIKLKSFCLAKKKKEKP